MAVNVEQWQMHEFELTSTVSYENAYYDIDVDVTFSGPNGEVIVHPAFWNGGDSWGVRFAPISLGDWTYTTSCSDPDNAGLIGQTGSITCVAYTGDKKIYQHGWLKKIDGERFLFYDDGTPFYWLGDTHWRFAILERWDESNKEGFDSQFKNMVDRRVSQEFTVYQSNLIGNIRFEAESDGNGFFIENTTFKLIDVDFFKNNVDRKMAYIAEQGFVNTMSFVWAWFLETDYVEQMKRFARYVVARYGAYPMIWSIVGEAAYYSSTIIAEELLERWRQIALEVKQVDGFQHLITIHFTQARPLPTYYVGEPWLDFVLGALGHGGESMNVSYYAEFFEEFPDIPYVEGEAFYDNLLTLEYPARRYVSAIMVRNTAYRAIQSGLCGYSYGAQGIWNAAWDSDSIDAQTAFWGTTDWATAIDSEIADQLTYMKHFYESLPWHELKPRKDIFSAYSGLPMPNYAPNVTANDDLSVIVYHCADQYSDFRSTWQLQNLPDATYSAKLFNPRTGEMTDSGQISTENGAFIVPSLPTASEDWLWLFEML